MAMTCTTGNVYAMTGTSTDADRNSPPARYGGLQNFVSQFQSQQLAQFQRQLGNQTLDESNQPNQKLLLLEEV